MALSQDAFNKLRDLKNDLSQLLRSIDKEKDRDLYTKYLSSLATIRQVLLDKNNRPVIQATAQTEQTPASTQETKEVTQEETTMETTTEETIAVQAISASVGKGGKNKKEDVKIIQTLLNNFGNSLTVDGLIGKNTINAIKSFQVKEVGYGKGDGRVDVGGKTWQTLTKSATTTEETPDETVEDNSDVTATSISGSVGKSGDNKKEDVKIVQSLLNNFGNSLTVDGLIGKNTIGAITKFQEKHAGMASGNGLVEKDSDTWKALNGATITPTETDTQTDDTKPDNSGDMGGGDTETTETTDTTDVDGSGTPDQGSDFQTMSTPDDETEEKLTEFFKNFGGLQVRVNPGETPEQMVPVTPPYVMNGTKKHAAGVANREKHAGVRKAISKTLGWNDKHGKATPDGIKAFLEECISNNIIPVKDRTSKGLRAFLVKYAISTDCTGLVSQAMNFMVDGNTDFDRKEDKFNINSAWWYQHDYSVIGSPKDLKAGDIMWLKGGKVRKVGHVRILIDVDIEGDEVVFVTAESTGAGDVVDEFSGDKKGGVGDVMWKYSSGTSYEGLQRSVDGGKTWKAKNTQDMEYRRFDFSKKK